MQTPHTHVHPKQPDPPWLPALPPAPPPQGADEVSADDALCAAYEAELQLLADAEGPYGTDWSDGPLSPSGCRW